ncbi:MAG: hypothetical protein ABI586_11265 [Candidatus Nanopelagicales bacterium]
MTSVLHRRAATVLAALLLPIAATLSLAPSASAAAPQPFTLHLACDNGQSYDVYVQGGKGTVAAFVNGSNSIAVLKNGNGTLVAAFSDEGPLAGHLVSCDTGIPGFTALVLFTPAQLR